MFIRSNRSQCGYTRDGQQKSGGSFLMLFSTEEKFTSQDGKTLPVVRAAVRSVRLSQLGHFMMGSARLGAYRLTLSGAYGDDGLTINPSKYPGLWDTLYHMPNDLAEKFWHGGGHNSAGSEAMAVREWAIAHEKELRKAGKSCSTK